MARGDGCVTQPEKNGQPFDSLASVRRMRAELAENHPDSDDSSLVVSREFASAFTGAASMFGLGPMELILGVIALGLMVFGGVCALVFISKRANSPKVPKIRE